jgi:hypothetical protein
MLSPLGPRCSRLAARERFPPASPAATSEDPPRRQSISWIVTPLMGVAAIRNKFEEATWCRETTTGTGEVSGYSVRSDKPPDIGPGGRIAYGSHRRKYCDLTV